MFDSVHCCQFDTANLKNSTQKNMQVFGMWVTLLIKTTTEPYVVA